MKRRDLLKGSIVGGATYSVLYHSLDIPQISASFATFEDVSIESTTGEVESISITIESFALEVINVTDVSSNISIEFTVDAVGKSDSIASDSLELTDSNQTFTESDISFNLERNLFEDTTEFEPDDFTVEEDGESKDFAIDVEFSANHPDVSETLFDDFILSVSNLDRFIIETAEDVEQLATTDDPELLDGDWAVVENVNMNNLSQDTIPPIGTPDIPFSGTLEGNDFTLSNLSVDTVAESNLEDNNAGLFKRLQDTAVIESWNLDSPSVTGGKNVGAIVGCVDSGTVRDCTVTDGNITSVGGELVSEEELTVGAEDYDNETNSVGGIVGLIFDGSVERCQVESSDVFGTTRRIGGIIGEIRGGSVSTPDNIVTSNSFIQLEQDGAMCGGLIGSIRESATIETIEGTRVEQTTLLGGNSTDSGDETRETTDYITGVIGFAGRLPNTISDVVCDNIEVYSNNIGSFGIGEFRADNIEVTFDNITILNSFQDIIGSGDFFGTGGGASGIVTICRGKPTFTNNLIEECEFDNPTGSAVRYAGLCSIMSGGIVKNNTIRQTTIRGDGGNGMVIGRMEDSNNRSNRIVEDNLVEDCTIDGGVLSRHSLIITRIGNATVRNNTVRDSSLSIGVGFGAGVVVGSIGGDDQPDVSPLDGSDASVEQGTIENITFTGGASSGFIIGSIFDTADGIELSNFTVEPSMVADNQIVSTPQDQNNLGGIIGRTNATGTLQNCKVTDVNIEGGDFVAGIIGSVDALNDRGKFVVEDCQVEGVNLSGIEDLGGICGFGRNLITRDCTVQNIDIDGTDERIGGLVGELWEGTIEDSTVNTALVNGLGNCGGAIGRITDSEITRCEIFDATVQASNSIGGVVGRQGDDSLVLACFSDQNTLVESNDTSTASRMGGIAGNIFEAEPGGTVKNCYSFATISPTNDVEEIIAGGITGQNAFDFGGVFTSGPDAESIVENCFFAGQVDSPDGSSSEGVYGGIVGENENDSTEGEIIDSYWEEDSAEQGVGNGDDPTIELSENEMTGEEAEDNMNGLPYDNGNETFTTQIDDFPKLVFQ